MPPGPSALQPLPQPLPAGFKTRPPADPFYFKFKRRLDEVYNTTDLGGRTNYIGPEREEQQLAAADDNSCDDEERTYRRICSQTHASLARSLAAARFRRGLVFEYPGRSLWGLGHALPAVYLLHDLCRQLRRFCYIQMYDMSLHELFGYASGERWAATPSELARYAPPSAWLNLTLDKVIHTEVSPSELVRRYSAHDDAPLLYVRSSAHLPFDSNDWLPLYQWDAQGRANRNLSRCVNRFVTQPLFEVDGRKYAPRKDVVHLRTGLADVPDAALRDSAAIRDPQLTRLWTNAACPDAPSGLFGRGNSNSGGPARRAHLLVEATGKGPSAAGSPKVEEAAAGSQLLIISDAPALVDAATSQQQIETGQQQPGAASPPPSITATSSRSSRSSRSWAASFESKLDAARDLVAAGRCSRAYTPAASSFMRAAIGRSVCVREAFLLAHASSPCRGFDHILPRGWIEVLFRSTGASAFEPDSKVWKPFAAPFYYTWRAAEQQKAREQSGGALDGAQKAQEHPCAFLTYEACRRSILGAFA